MRDENVTCNDLDAVGVYIINGKALSPVGISRVMVCAGGDDSFSLQYMDLSQAVCFEAVGEQTRVYYSADEEKGQMLLDCAVDDVENVIVSSLEQGDSRFARMGNYYIVNIECMHRVENKGKRLLLRDANHYPVVFDAPEKPSGRECDEYRRLMPNYGNHPLYELCETQPGLVEYMIKFKRNRSFESSLIKLKELILAHYGK